MQLTPRITLFPYLHGRVPFATQVRSLLLERRFDCIAVDLPELFADELPPALEALPLVTALTATAATGPVWYLPVDPCDAAIEALRQAGANRVPGICIGSPQIARPTLLSPLPDSHAIEQLGFTEFVSLCLSSAGRCQPGSDDDRSALQCAHRLHELEEQHRSVLCLLHLGIVAAVVEHFSREYSWNYSPPPPAGYAVERVAVNPDHLYFALGELPFVTARYEKARFDPFAPPVEPATLIKELFRETRDEYRTSSREREELSPARIQVALTFLRNLTVHSAALFPSLFDIVTAAKGVGGNAYALAMLTCARYYPWLPVDSPLRTLSVSIDRVRFQGEANAHEGVNLLTDTERFWRRLTIRPEPDHRLKHTYRYTWNPAGICSHLPDDERIERFNGYLRSKALRIRAEDQIRSEKFTTSLKDGIDIRQTLRNWHTAELYVREIPSARGRIDTVVIIFDADHDERYPHRGTWYAEHTEESTLSFYATEPFDDLIGPGIARSHYGGVSMLFPPRPVPNPFGLVHPPQVTSAAHQLLWGSLLYSGERCIAFVAARKPTATMQQSARRCGKHLIWIPLASFSAETLRKLRCFHVLNGKEVRGWASRFTGE